MTLRERYRKEELVIPIAIIESAEDYTKENNPI